MSDTVSGLAIVSSLGVDGPVFVASDLGQASVPDALHVNGAVRAEQAPLGLLVEFRTLSPDFQAVPSGVTPEPAATVAGYAAPLPDAPTPAIVSGGLHTD